MQPMRLPLLERHVATLEKCVYCPKLSRAACPVSNAEASETVTPWGKMSMAYFLGRGDFTLDETNASPAWACSACFACRERCEHKNDVATTLEDARAELFARGLAPAGARAAAARWGELADEASRVLLGLGGTNGEADRGGAVMLVGCSYALNARDVASDALRAAERLLGRPVRPARVCCGLPLLYAGDRPGFEAAARLFAQTLAAESPERFIALDPGCARTVLVDHARVGVAGPRPELFVDLAAQHLDALRPIAQTAVRYHDPCQLGRGLGRYDEPRAVLARITNATPREFVRNREHGECSGAGGLLPATRPETSRAIADARIGEHRERGGGTLVTACAASLRRFRSRGEPAEDLATLIARAL